MVYSLGLLPYTLIIKMVGHVIIICLMIGAAVDGQTPIGKGLCTSPQAISNRIFIQDIPESKPVGSVIRQLQILGSNTEIRVEESQGDPHVRFDPVSRNLTLQQPLDREQSETVNLKLDCTILATSQKITIPVNIIISDVNDNPPVFLKPQYSANISELTPTGTTVIRDIRAEDKDIDNWYITYEIVPGTYSSYFEIPIPGQGEVVLKKTLDFENLKTMTFQIMAKDIHVSASGRQGTPLNSTTTVVVSIFDGDDQNPVFLNAPYKALVLEGTPVNTVLKLQPPIRAVDQDLGINAVIVYSLLDDTTTQSSEYFQIDPVTAEVTLTSGALSRRTVFTPLIRATQADNEDRFTTTVLRIQVVAANENPPRFTQNLYVVDLVENTPVGTVVTTLEAVDNDEGSALTYSFAAGQEVADFVLDQRGGILQTARTLDYERSTQYNLTVRVDDGGFHDEAVVTVNVLDINDNPPTFTQPDYLFLASFAEKGRVGQVKAIDRDVRSKITYRFQQNITLFSLTDTGEIFISASKNEFIQNEYHLFITATDDGTPPREDAVVAIVMFEPLVAEVGGGLSGENNLLLIIILGVICGCLLVIIVIMIVYIYKSRLKARKPKTDFVKSQSFESRLNVNRDIASRTYLDDPQGLNFKPTKAHHLALYNDIQVDDVDATSPQDNPFMPDDNVSVYTATSAPYRYRYDAQDINDNMSKQYNSSSSNDLNRQMAGVNEIEYDTAVTPIHRRTETPPTPSHVMGRNESSTDDDLPPPPPSIHSSTQSIPGSMSTFRAGGSTQKLMTPRGTPKGSVNKRPSVSFVDDHEINIYHPQHAIDPGSTQTVTDDDRPGITIYY